jgi:hypothetical protein
VAKDVRVRLQDDIAGFRRVLGTAAMLGEHRACLGVEGHAPHTVGLRVLHDETIRPVDQTAGDGHAGRRLVNIRPTQR